MYYSDLYKNKTALVTGHTGFKGSWLTVWLNMLGAKVVGYSLDPYSDRGNFMASHLPEHMAADVRGDVRDYDHLNETVKKYQPDIVFHLAAQALVKTSYDEPKYTYETNLMGSLNVLEAVRHNDCLKTIVMITSDKCYANVEQIWGYKESDRVGGYDPYSSSKGCAELMISSWRNSFFHPTKYSEHGKAVASVRAGNVIGGGDWSSNRLIPDCIRAIESDQDILIRNPHSTRPWQHVLEPLSGYLRVGEKLMQDPVGFSDSYNFGPPLRSNRTVQEVVEKLVKIYGKGHVVDASPKNAVHEDKLLNLDVTKAFVKLGWSPKFSLDESLEYTIDWYKHALQNQDMYDFCIQQIQGHANHTEE